MSKYSINFIIIIFYIILHKFFFPKNKKAIASLITIQFILLLSLRNAYFGNIDMMRYANKYNILGKMKLVDTPFYANGSSWLYYLLNSIFSKMGASFQFFVSCISIFCVGIVGRYIYKYSKNIVMGFAIYLGMGCYGFAFYGMRQTIAMALVLLCLEQYWKKKYFKTSIYVCLAISFHTTAIIIIPFLFLSRFEISRITIMFYMTLLMIIAIYRMQIARAITVIYDNSYIDFYQSMKSLGGTSIFLFFVLMLYLFTNFNEILMRGTRECQLFHSLVIICIIQVFASYAYAFSRLNLYYMQSLLVLIIPESLYYKKIKMRFGKSYNLVKNILYVIILVVMIIQSYDHLQAEYLTEYMFFWEQL